MRAFAISGWAALFAAGCGALAGLAPAQTTPKQTGVKSTRTQPKSTGAKSVAGSKSLPAAKPGAKSTAAAPSGSSRPPGKAAGTTSAADKATGSRAGASPATSKAQVAKSATAKAGAAKASSGKGTPARSASLPAASAKGTSVAAGKGAGVRSGVRPPASSYRAPPQQPSVDRYREIQQALADRGYFAGPVDGNWAATSTDALKRFQHDQNLLEDGKVGALSLIALGLGPKRGAAGAPTANPPGKTSPQDNPPAQSGSPEEPPQ